MRHDTTDRRPQRHANPRFWLTHRQAYLWLALLVVLTRAAYVVYDQTYLSVSGAELERAAASLAREGTLGNIYTDSSGPSAHVSPLYPSLLAGLYRIWGWDTVAGRIAQEALTICATALGLLLLPALARATALSVRAGWLAAFTLALSPTYLWVESSGSWEQPYAALVLYALIFLHCRLRSEEWTSPWTTAYLGVAFGAAALLSPVLLPSAVLMLANEAYIARRQPVRLSIGLLLVAGVTALVVTPWIARNYAQFRTFVPLRSTFGLELAIGNNDWATGRSFGTTLDDPNNPMMAHHPFTSSSERARLLQLGETDYMAERQREAFSWLRHNPTRAAELVGLRFAAFWFPQPVMWPEFSPARLLKSVSLTAVGATAWLALLFLLWRRHSHARLLAAAAVGPSILYLITHVDPRYRYPVVGLTTVLAFDAWLRVVRFLGRSRPPAASTA